MYAIPSMKLLYSLSYPSQDIFYSRKRKIAILRVQGEHLGSEKGIHHRPILHVIIHV